ncbi:MAG: hypothetical protein J6I32_00170 [Bacteroidaceae bacterium]|nr:hypothetical protein [Bacteroidaceae bacterium]
MIKKIIAFVLLFSFIYQINYIFLPFNVPFVLGFIGLPLYIHNSSVIRNSDNKYVRDLLLALLPVAIVAFLSIVGNHSSDFYFVKWAIINALYFFGAYFLFQLLKHSFRNFTVGRLVDMLVVCAVVQLSLALVMYFSPEVKNVLQPLIHESEIAKEAMERAATRMIGFGTHFFLSGTVHAFILIMIAFRLTLRKVSLFKSVVLMLSFIFIAAVGTMMARTTLVGVLFAIVIVLLRRRGKKYFISGLVLSTIIISATSVSFLDLIGDDMEQLFNFGFEAFVNYQETGSFSTSSTDGMMRLFKFPTTWETWLWGDARYEAGIGYYMNTDVGFCRLIFYFGVIGLITYMYFEYYILKKIFPPQIYGNIIWSVLFCFVLVINGKGTFDLFPYACLFVFFICPSELLRNIIKELLEIIRIAYGKKNSNRF